MVEVEDVVAAELRGRLCGLVGSLAVGGEELRAAGDDEEKAQGKQQGAKGSGWVSDCNRLPPRLQLDLHGWVCRDRRG